MRDYDYARRIERVCKECNQRWLWPCPRYAKRIHPPENCPECRNKGIETLNKEIETLHGELLKQLDAHYNRIQRIKWAIESLTPHPKEQILRNQ